MERRARDESGRSCWQAGRKSSEALKINRSKPWNVQGQAANGQGCTREFPKG